MALASATFEAAVRRLRAAGCVFADDEAQVLCAAASTTTELDVMIERRAAGVPLEHVVGWAWFCGLRVAVDPGVFVPRRRTELLVREAASLVVQAGSKLGRRLVVIDLCCGSGAVGAALAARLDDELDQLDLLAADIDALAVACARANLATVGARVYEGDLYDALPPDVCGRIDILVANVPYVPTAEIALLPTEARRHEPRIALDGGADGLGLLRRVAAAAPRWLAPGGHLLIETSARQVPNAIAAFTSAGLRSRVVTDADLDASVVVGNRTAA